MVSLKRLIRWQLILTLNRYNFNLFDSLSGVITVDVYLVIY